AVRSIDYTVVFARDLPAMRRFYGEMLGFALQRELSGSWIEYRVGSNILALTVSGNGRFDDPPPPAGALSLQLAFRVAPAEVFACAAALEAAGIALLEPPTDQPWGHRTLFFRDPDGNVLEIYAEI
ncbi:MAG TPA: VOC family protein, partial [Burkholderiaceae bacterium]|nr:VOC family protein [Burkholderiaceae bacterium]